MPTATLAEPNVYAAPSSVDAALNQFRRLLYRESWTALSKLPRPGLGGWTIEDLFQDGVIQLMQAMRRYDPARGESRFIHYLTVTLRNHYHQVINRAWKRYPIWQDAALVTWGDEDEEGATRVAWVRDRYEAWRPAEPVDYLPPSPSRETSHGRMGKVKNGRAVKDLAPMRPEKVGRMGSHDRMGGPPLTGARVE